MTEDVDEPLLATGEAAAAVGVTRRSLSRWAADGRVRPTLVTAGHQFRWRLSDLRRQLDALEGGHGPDASREG